MAVDSLSAGIATSHPGAWCAVRRFPAVPGVRRQGDVAYVVGVGRVVTVAPGGSSNSEAGGEGV